MRPAVISVGTTHPWNVAGLGLDIAVSRELGALVLTVVAGVSAQGPATPIRLLPVGEAMIDAQFAALASAPADALRIGALLDPASVAAVARGIAARAALPTVCDPVIAASDGGVLADASVGDALARLVFPQCTLVTPNLPEAEAFLGERIAGVDAMEGAAQRLRARCGAHAVLLKGGHLDDRAVDVLAWSDGVVRYEAPRLPGSLRGTGCLLALAAAVALARGRTLVDAVADARAFVRATWESAHEFGGMRSAL